MKPIGIVLIVLGVIGLAYGGLSWTTKEKVVDMGPLQVTQEKTHSVPFTPIAGGVCLVAGVLLLISGGRQKS